MNKTFAIVLMLAFFAAPGCSQADDSAAAKSGSSASPSTKPASDSNNAQEENKPMAKKTYSAEPEMKIDPNKTYIATIETTAGTMVAELYPKLAPHHVNSFVFLAKDGYYEGVIFHRVIPGFMIQGGDPTGTGGGGPGYKLKQEFNATKHEPGVLSMARTNDPNSAGSQFFVMHQNAPFLDNQYPVFGRLKSGQEVVDKIVSAPRNANDRPNDPTSIKKITIEEK